MSDEQEYPRTPRAPGEAPGPGDTRPLPPISEQTHPDEGPRSGEAASPWISDRTEQMPATPPGAGADSTRVMPAGDDETRLSGDRTGMSGDETRVAASGGAPDATAMLPPTDVPGAGPAAAAGTAIGGPGQPAREQVWSARAEVRPPRPGEAVQVTEPDWAPAAPEPRGAWWMPILIGIVVLLLLGVLGFGVWLILQGADQDDSPPPVVTTSAARATTQPTAEPTAEPTTARPTTTAPQPSPTPAEPEEVTVPDVAGRTSSEARQALDRAGLSYRLVFRPSRSVPAGTVIDSNPPEGTQVPADTEVTLVIATAPSPEPTATTATPTADTGQPDG